MGAVRHCQRRMPGARVTSAGLRDSPSGSPAMSDLRIIAVVLALLTLPGTAAAAEPVQPRSVPAVPSAGCGVTPVRSLDHEPGSMGVDGTERSWVTAAPSAHDGVSPVPLLLMLHGLAGSPAEIRSITASGLHEEKGFVVVAPLGSGLISRWMWDLDDTEYDLSRSNPDIAFI